MYNISSKPQIIFNRKKTINAPQNKENFNIVHYQESLHIVLFATFHISKNR